MKLLKYISTNPWIIIIILIVIICCIIFKKKWKQNNITSRILIGIVSACTSPGNCGLYDPNKTHNLYYSVSKRIIFVLGRNNGIEYNIKINPNDIHDRVEYCDNTNYDGISPEERTELFSGSGEKALLSPPRPSSDGYCWKFNLNGVGLKMLG